MEGGEEKKLTIDIFRKQIDFLVLPERFADKLRKIADIFDAIKNVISESPKTAEEIANALKMDIHRVTWYLITFQKYGYVKIAGKDDEGRYKFIWSEELEFG